MAVLNAPLRTSADPRKSTPPQFTQGTGYDESSQAQLITNSISEHMYFTDDDAAPVTKVLPPPGEDYAPSVHTENWNHESSPSEK